MFRRLIESESRWIHALLVLSTLTVALILTDLVARYVTYFSDVLVMLIVAWLFAFILSPLVGILQRIVPKLPRTVAVVLVYGSLFVVLSGVVLLVANQLAASVTDFIRQYPADAGEPAHHAPALAGHAQQPGLRQHRPQRSGAAGPDQPQRGRRQPGRAADIAGHRQPGRHRQPAAGGLPVAVRGPRQGQHPGLHQPRRAAPLRR